MPTLVLFLAKLGLVTARFLIKNMKYAILIMFIVGAVLSPGTDPVGQIAMAGPMFLLYLFSILLAWLFGKKRTPRGGVTRARSPAPRQLCSATIRSPREPRWRGCACIGAARRSGAADLRRRRTPPPGARAAALAALEGSKDARAVAVGAAGAGRPRRRRRRWPPSACCADGSPRNRAREALEALTVAALDRERDGAVRLAALDALSDLPAHLVAPIRATSALEHRRAAAGRRRRGAASGWRRRATAPRWPAVHDALSAAREAERTAADARRDEWRACPRRRPRRPGAPRQSRLALYDLRETFGAAAAPLPLDFLTAVAQRGRRHLPGAAGARLGGARGEPWWRSAPRGSGGRHRRARRADRPPRER